MPVTKKKPDLIELLNIAVVQVKKLQASKKDIRKLTS